MKKANRKTWIIIGSLTLGVVAWMTLSGDSATEEEVPTFIATRGPLQVDVLQGGEIRALNNFEVKSEIEVPTKIISIIPEGYLITEEDIKDGKVLVELDSSELKARIQDHEIDFQTTVATYIDADEGREIQRSENQSLVRDMKESGVFALMDFEKYLGRDLTAKILSDASLPSNGAELDKFAAVLDTQSNTPTNTNVIGKSKPADAKVITAGQNPKKVTLSSERIDFSPFLEGQASGDGEAQQKLRQLGDELLLRKSELSVAKQKVESSERLSSKGFITKTQLELDQVAYEKVTLSLKTAETQLSLFTKYEFSKQCALLLSAYRESLTKLERTVRANRSKMAQAETRFQTSKRRYEMQLAKTEELERQLKACTIKATQQGLVAYGDLDAGSSYNYSNSIEEGASVRLRQTILTIPDMAQMGVMVKIHESQVKKVKVGQPVLIRVDAEPGKVLEGRVAELALLPDSSSSRYTPNLKVYPANIHIIGNQPWLKPGMNAKAEIIVDQLAEVLYVPVQSIEVEADQHFCYIRNNGKLERRSIKTGVFNDEFIEVRDGLQSGESVAISLPKRATMEDSRPDAPSILPGENQKPIKPKAKEKSKDVAAAAKPTPAP
ncbi:MAG: efflux RND transporter periplasmic adaptor subunit [Verrucomicrobia bacterium]|nr:efflux RND transporter periplasmic adaptor subunit [Verrucomicrobiota bacterium]